MHEITEEDLKLVKKIVNQYKYSVNIYQDDLESDGCYGLVKAASCWPRGSVPWEPFAIRSIRSAIIDGIRRRTHYRNGHYFKNYKQPVSLERILTSDDGKKIDAQMPFSEDTYPLTWEAEELLSRIQSCIPPRHFYVLMCGKSPAVLSKELGVSTSRIKQIRIWAKRKIIEAGILDNLPVG